jgi:peroxiredoxin
LKTAYAESQLAGEDFPKQFFANFISEGGLSMPEVGDMAPDFELKSHLHKDKKVRLSDFRGSKNVVLAFYPLAWTPV